MNTARSALSCILYQDPSTTGTDLLLTRFINGVFQTRMVKSIIFEKLRENSVLSLKFFTLELAMSVASTFVERSQLIHNLNEFRKYEQY